MAGAKPARATTVKKLAAALPFLSGLTDAEVDVILPLCRAMTTDPGDVLIREGKPVKNLYLLLSGEATVAKKRADGKSVLLATVGKNDVLGELSFLQSVSASATVKVKKPCNALTIDQRDLQRLLLTNPNLAAKLYKKLALIASRRLSALLRHHFEGRTAL